MKISKTRLFTDAVSRKYLPRLEVKGSSRGRWIRRNDSLSR